MILTEYKVPFFLSAVVCVCMSNGALFSSDCQEPISYERCWVPNREVYKTRGQFHWPTMITYKNPGGYFTEAIKDIILLHKNLFTFDSFKLVSSFFPLFVVSRSFDCRLQNFFYCPKHHKNLNQLDQSCTYLARFGVGIPIVVLGSCAFLSTNQDLRMTSWIFLLGMPFVIFGKDVLKSIKIEACKRPWNEHFSSKKQAYGGFPSGHMAEATYMAVLFGKRFGYKFGLPLAASAIFLGAAFLNCNRHYFSQLVAGVALGAIYALAADKLITQKLAQGSSLRFGCTKEGKASLSYTCSF